MSIERLGGNTIMASWWQHHLDKSVEHLGGNTIMT